jgi:hypothetical protein
MATSTFVGVPQPDSSRKPLSILVESARVGAHFARRDALPLSRQDSHQRRRRKTLLEISPDPQPKAPRAHEFGASIRRRDRDRADSLAEEGPVGFPAERAASIQFELVLISILDYETNYRSTRAANLF